MLNTSKRRRRTSDSALATTRRRLSNVGPFSGLVICLTGLPAEEKTRLHRAVEQLGGSYARNLDTSKTTHLISQQPEGAKYETAQACSRIHIVTPQWLTACFREGKRVEESAYPLAERGIVTRACDENDATNNEEDSGGGTRLQDLLQDILQENTRRTIFYPCNFLLLGFAEESRVVLLLERLIQRGRGTIYHEINESITHVLVNDGSDQVLINAAETISAHHPLGPSYASPLWAVESWKAGSLLQASDYLPRKASNRVVTKLFDKQSDKVARKTASSTLFRGSLFALIRLAPPQGAVDYDASQLTDDILSNGGQVVSQKVVDALRADQRLETTTRRTCFVVCWGGFSKTHMSMHSLLSQISNQDLCTTVPVSVIWLKTAISDGKLPSLNHPQQSLLFQPQPWPLQRLNDGKNLNIAITGFVHAERTGVIQLIRAVGAPFTESFSTANTHLICQKPQGPKYEKAIGWRIHVVSIDWLYEVARYGFAGVRGTGKTGCESDFSLLPPSLNEGPG